MPADPEIHSFHGIVKRLALGLALAVVASGCDNDPYCPEGKSWCWAQCVDLMSDNENCGRCDNTCEPGWDCVDGSCRDPCDEIPRCNTHFCPATSTFECSYNYVDWVICTCPVEGGCDYDKFKENCAYPSPCACENGECYREPDCPYGLVCSGGDKASCKCASGPLTCPAANRTCDDIIDDMLEFHAENSTCVDDWDCYTIRSTFYLVDNICCNIYLSRYANAGIWHILERQLRWVDDPECDRLVDVNCCMAPAPPGRCIDGKCGP